jgi:uncharacterized damage-inducible protein DinB
MAFDRSQVDVLAQGAAKLRIAISGLSDSDLQARPGPGKWSIQEVIVHIADADCAFAFRIKQIIAEDNPTLQAWSENQFIERLNYPGQSVETALTLIDATRKQIAVILKDQPDAAFARTGTHTQRGAQSVADVIGYCVWHLDHHLTFIEGKRANLKK